MQHDAVRAVDFSRFTRPQPLRRLPLTRGAACLVVVAMAAGQIARALAQTPAGPATPAAAAIAIGGDVRHPVSLTAGDIKAMPRTAVK